jgi:integrase/recombinase XerD
MTAIHSTIDDYVAALAIEGKAKCTVEVYGARLRRFAEWCITHGRTKPESLSAADLRGYIAHLQAKSNGNGTPRQNAVVVKGFSRWLFSEGRLQADPFASVKLAKLPRRIPEPFSDEEVKLLLKVTRHTRDPQRNKAILLILLDSGLRVSELVSLDLEHIRFEDGTAMTRSVSE